VSKPSASSALQVSNGSPFPLGATPLGEGRVNFAVASQYGTAVDLVLFADPARPWAETHRLPLPKRSGDTWHGEVSGIPPGALYGYRVDGPWTPEEGHLYNPHKLLLDPYAKHLPLPSRHYDSMKSLRHDGLPSQADSATHAPKAAVPRVDGYDWEGDVPLGRPMAESVVYELHVKGFSMRNPGIPPELRGTYAGLGHAASLAYLKELGVTAVQLLPVHQHLDDSFLLEKGLVNYWGYNSIGYFAPEARYAAGADPVREFRDMVKALHREGIEVILDVVYNHTGEGGIGGPTCLFRGFDNLCYYHTVPKRPGIYWDSTGCGNSVAVSHPRTLRLVMDSLRYWVEEMHVDGFRFDLAVELGRDPLDYRRRSAFFRALHQDPVLTRVKLIAEPWDLGPDGYQQGNFPTEWSELNGRFRDTVRAFWHGDPGVMGAFAARITGSEDLFAHNRRGPGASVNFVTSHDGFTLHDLVSYNRKHNLANGEDNLDGDNHERSYNHGVEGATDDPLIRALRQRQCRNFLATLICSQGTPFLLGGDERLRSQRGNNNAYCQDNEISWLDWSESEDPLAMRAFVARLLAFRREHPELRRPRFLTGQAPGDGEIPDVSWHRPDGVVKRSADWNGKRAGAFAMLLRGEAGRRPLLFFFNARWEATEFHFPKEPDCRWRLELDTADPSKEETANSGVRHELADRSLQIWKGEC